MTLLEEMLRMRAIKCPHCDQPYTQKGWGEDEWGVHAILVPACACPQEEKKEPS